MLLCTSVHISVSVGNEKETENAKGSRKVRKQQRLFTTKLKY